VLSISHKFFIQTVKFMKVIIFSLVEKKNKKGTKSRSFVFINVERCRENLTPLGVNPSVL
jgi:hypothetical protein